MPVPSVAVFAAVALAGGAALGVGLEQSGAFSPLDEPEPVPVRVDRVDLLDCPEGVPVARLTRGDRIVATGRSEDGAWIEIRSPVDLDHGAWLPVAAVAPDDGRALLDDLPEAECERTVLSTTTTATSSTTTSTSSSTTSSTTTTTTVTATTVPTATTRPGPTPTTTPTTAPPADTTPPTVGTPVAQAPFIIERTAANPTACPTAPGAVSTTVSVTASDDRPGVTVSMTFSTAPNGPDGGPVPMAANGGTFTATLGPFTDAAQTIPTGTFIDVEVQARDAAGNLSGLGTMKVEIRECPVPP